ncbi:MAG: NAD(P)/FAD-dependent oxidoreductase, partial [Saprospiraceae bacterium]
MEASAKTRPHVVVIGGGFAGLEFAKGLKNKAFDVTLVDKHNYHTFQPLLYQVATGGLEPDSIAYPLRKVFRKTKNVFVRWATVKHIDTETQVLSTDLCDMHYDYLVIATGSTGRYFNFEGIKDKMLTLKTVPDALNLRSYILQNFEKAIAEKNPEYLEELMNIAIVGGGPTGLELAGAIGEMK